MIKALASHTKIRFEKSLEEVKKKQTRVKSMERKKGNKNSTFLEIHHQKIKKYELKLFKNLF